MRWEVVRDESLRINDLVCITRCLGLYWLMLPVFLKILVDFRFYDFCELLRVIRFRIVMRLLYWDSPGMVTCQWTSPDGQFLEIALPTKYLWSLYP
jgi:hypothetical protein